MTVPAASAHAVFLSYASQDAEAAQRICDALRAAGVEVWFDRNELVGGDAWDQKIRRQIKECALFVPLVSPATNARPEGYFRLEWKLAVDRSHLMADDAPFLFPVALGDVTDGTARVPDKFRDVQWTRLRLDETPAELAARIQRLLAPPASGDARSRPPSPVARTRRGQPAWLRYAWAGVGVVFALIYAVRPLLRQATTREATPSPPTVAPAAVTEAQRLTAQARQILDAGDELNRESYLLAEELVKRATTLDPADAAAATLAAELSYRMVWYGLDSSQARVTLMRQQAERAVALAPAALEARLVRCNVQIQLRENLEGCRTTLQQLAEDAPANWRVQRALGQAYRYLRQPDPALQAMRRACELSGGDASASADLVNVMMTQNRFAEAEAVVAEALPRHPTGRLMAFDVLLKTQWRGDLSAATAAAARWPDWLLREDRGANIAWRAWYWARRPAEALAIAQGVSRDYLHDYYFSGPRAVLTARAQELAGHVEAARADWREVVQLTNRELAADPTNPTALGWKAWALSRLGENDEAQAIGRQMLQQNVTAHGLAFTLTTIAPFYATLGMLDPAFAELRSLMQSSGRYGVARAALELEPAYEPLRRDPRYAELLRLAPAPAAAVSAPATPDEKSVAVLAFANLSEDKANEYFSDGISEELLTVLQKIPGLKVSARTSAFSFKGSNAAAQEIGRTLGVANLVEGSVRKAGSQVRITARLSRAATGEQLWSESYTRDLKDVFSVQTELAQAIVVALRAKLLGETGAEVRNQVASQVNTAQQGGTSNVEAHELYLQGKYFANQPSLANIDKALDCFQRAVDADASFALAWAALGRTVALQTEYLVTTSQDIRERFARARRAVDRALALDPNLADGYFARLEIQTAYDYDWVGARESTERTLVLAPSNALLISNASQLAAQFGDLEKGIRLGRQAAELDPVNAEVRYWLARVYQMAGRLPEAEAEFRRAAELSPSVLSIHRQLSVLLVQQGRPEAAVAEARLEGYEWSRQAALAVACWAAKDVRGADAALARLIAVAADSAGYQVAEAYAFRGEADAAFEWLERAYLNRDSGMGWVRMDPLLKNLHDDPRWTAFIRKVGLADDQLNR